MDVRKVQRFGKSTLMVSLPADWVKSVNLKPGTSVYIDVEEDGSLKIFPPSYNPQNVKREISVKVSEKTDPELLDRVLRSLYILGYDSITIASESGMISNEILRKTRELTRDLIGLEMVTQDLNTIEVKSYIDPTKHNFNVLFSQFVGNLKLMVTYLSYGIKNASRRFIEEVIELEKEVDRLYYLALRQLILAQMNRNLAYIMGIPTVQIIGNRIIIKSLEEAADDISEAANDLLSLPPDTLSKLQEYYDKLSVLLNQMETLIDHIAKLRTEWKLEEANEVLEELRVLRKTLLIEAEGIQSSLVDKKGSKASSKVVGFLLRLYSAVRKLEPIAEISINRSIENLKEINLA